MAFRGTKGDDYNFVLQANEYSLLEWVYTRFMTRSGRIAAEVFIWIFAHVPLVCWKVVTMLLSISLGIYLYKYAALFGGKPSAQLSFFCAMAPFLMNEGAFVDGTLWITGSMNYMWISVPGIIGMYYVARDVFDEKYVIGKLEKVMVFGLILITISSSEQMGAVIIVLLSAVNMLDFFRKRVDPYKALLWGGCVLLYVLDVVLAPGVALRTAQAVKTRIPDFLTVSLYFRAQYSLRWIMDALVNHMGMLLNVVWLLILLLLFRKKEKKVFDKLVMFILLVAETMTLLKTKIPMLFEFEATWGIQNFSRASYYAIATWIVILLTTV